MRRLHKIALLNAPPSGDIALDKFQIISSQKKVSNPASYRLPNVPPRGYNKNYKAKQEELCDRLISY